MKKSTYMDRAMKAKDPRFARILGSLGYVRSDLQATPKSLKAPKADEITMLRAEYQRVVGKKPFGAWKADKLREKIAAAKG